MGKVRIFDMECIGPHHIGRNQAPVKQNCKKNRKRKNACPLNLSGNRIGIQYCKHQIPNVPINRNQGLICHRSQNAAGAIDDIIICR